MGVFSYLRFMNYFAITQTIGVTSGGTATTSCFWNVVPFEACVAMCNKFNSNLWLNIQTTYTDTATATLATLIHQGSGTDSLGHTWAGLNSNLNVVLEFSNEWWNSLFGTNLTQIAPAGYVAYPGLQSYYASFNGTVDDGAGGAGNILHATSVVGNNGNPGITNNTQHANTIFGSGLGSGIGIASDAGGGGGNGDYIITGPAIHITVSTPMTQGSNQSAWQQLCINRSIATGQIFKNVWATNYGDSSRIKVAMGIQAVGGGVGMEYYLTQGPTSWGGYTFSANCTISGFNLTINSGLSGTVAVGQEIHGIGVAPATYIQSGSGTSWVVNNSQSAGPTTMTGQYWYNSVASYLDAICIAPYFSSDITGQSANTYFASTAAVDVAAALANVAGAYSRCQNPSFGNGLLLYCYEMGQHYTTTAGNISTIVNDDPRMYGVMKGYFDGLGPNGAVVSCYFQGVTKDSNDNNWGCLPDLLAVPSSTATDGSAKYQALIDFQTPDVTPTTGGGETKGRVWAGAREYFLPYTLNLG